MNWAGEDLEFLSVINDALVKHENATFAATLERVKAVRSSPHINYCPARSNWGYRTRVTACA